MHRFTVRFIARRFELAGTIGLAVTALWLAGAAAAGAQCVGDCSGDGSVAINELILGVNIALGSQPTSACPAFQDQSGMVNISQLIKGVNNALGSCPVGATPTATSGAETPTPTPTLPTATPSNTPSGSPVCGNHTIETGETCDDGNTMDGDNCPSDCVIHDCQVTASTLAADVTIQLPAETIAGALQVLVHYPDGVVALPSSGSQASVAISNLPDDAFSTAVNDLDYAVRVVSVGPDGLTLGDTPPHRFFTAQFTLCQGAAAPVASDFACTVENATSIEGSNVTAQTSCSVVLP